MSCSFSISTQNCLMGLLYGADFIFVRTLLRKSAPDGRGLPLSARFPALRHRLMESSGDLFFPHGIRKTHLFCGLFLHFFAYFLLFVCEIMSTDAISTNFCPQLSFLCEYYKKVEKLGFLRLILRFIWHTIGDERILETNPKRFD